MSARKAEPLSEDTTPLRIYIDGASKGNPGEAGAGILITDRHGRRLAQFGRYLGHQTNNQAEYWALLLGLREAKRLGGKSIEIFTDSELLERQVRGLYRVKALNLKGLHRAVMKDLEGFASFQIESIPRAKNQEADRLATQAIQRRFRKEREGIQKRGTDGRSS
ncbi:MAG: ribonuclease HI family protein [Thermodesulfobacteriota bacterium]